MVLFFIALKALSLYFLDKLKVYEFCKWGWSNNPTLTYGREFSKFMPFILNGLYLESLFVECNVHSFYFIKHLCKYCSPLTKQHNVETNYLEVNWKNWISQNANHSRILPNRHTRQGKHGSPQLCKDTAYFGHNSHVSPMAPSFQISRQAHFVNHTALEKQELWSHLTVLEKFFRMMYIM